MLFTFRSIEEYNLIMIWDFRVPSLSVIMAELAKGITQWNYPDCAAPFWRLYWNRSGLGQIEYGGEVYGLEGSAVILIPPETHFAARSDESMDHLFFHFIVAPPFDRVLPCVAFNTGTPGELAELSSLASALELSKDLVRAPNLEGAARGEPAALLMRSTGLCYYWLSRFPSTSIPPPESEAVTDRVAAFVRTRLDRPPSIGRIAEELGVSVPTLERKLRQRTGLSAHEYALWIRIGEGCILLRHTDESIDRIAERLGFVDRSHFSRVFSRLRGENPSSYRHSSP